MARLALSPLPPDRAEADLLVLPVAAGEAGPAAPPVTAAVLERLGTDLAAVAGPAGRFTGKLDDVVAVPGYGALAAPAVLLVGVGPDAERTAETLRRAAAVAVAAAGKAATMAVALHRAGLPGPPGDHPGGPPDPPGPAAPGGQHGGRRQQHRRAGVLQ
ncbi:MAG: M17 family peptidase N-terminal domain-containing protein, partial [Actinomycetes bacterium]